MDVVLNIMRFWSLLHTIWGQQLVQMDKANDILPITSEANDTDDALRAIFSNKFTKSPNKDMTFYWNIPTFMCAQRNITFKDLQENYGIIQNEDDAWRGNQIVIMYDPGKFPALLEHQGQLYKRNGGVPQEGNLQEHIDAFAEHVNEIIPDVNYAGISVIDFESWRPIFRQNFGVLQPYIDLSVKLVMKEHKYWKKKRAEQEAKKLFEEAGRNFVEQTIKIAKFLRPKAKWGYYGFPYCFNMNGGANTNENCPSNVKAENEDIKWLWDAVDLVLPSIYLNTKINGNQREQYVRGRMREGNRVAQMSSRSVKPEVYGYLRNCYTDTLKYLTNDDLKQSIKVAQAQKSDGIIFWGSSFDLKKKQQCLDFKKYVDNNLGPVVATFRRTPKILSPKMT